MWQCNSSIFAKSFSLLPISLVKQTRIVWMILLVYTCTSSFLLPLADIPFQAEAVKHTIQICGIVRGLFLYKECRYPGALVNAAEILAYCE